MVSGLTILSLLSSILLVHGHNASSPISSGESPTIRDYFYVGGRYVDDGTGSGQHIFTGQMYVEKLTPWNGTKHPHPLVFIHGQAQTGTNWLNKPDGSKGWASYFVSKGYEVYLIDQTYRARSDYHANEGTLSNYSTEIIQQRFTAPQDYNLWPQAKLHTQWPGTGVMGDTYYDTYYASNVAFIASATVQQSSVQAAGAALLDRIGKPVILIAHSQGGLMPWLIGDARTNLTKAILAIEPTGPPFFEAIFSNTAARPYGLTDVPLTYSPPVTNATTDLHRAVIASPGPAPYYIQNCTIQATTPPPRKFTNLAKIPTMVMTTEASYHVPYDWCTVAYLQQAGVNVTHLNLPDIGVHGNGHLVFLEKNSEQVAGIIQERWFSKFE